MKQSGDMSNKQVEKWEKGGWPDQYGQYWIDLPNGEIINFDDETIAERIANLPVLEDEHRQMKELLKSIVFEHVSHFRVVTPESDIGKAINLLKRMGVD